VRLLSLRVAPCLAPLTSPLPRRTGLKALPHARLPVHGDVLHDSHAEVIARRGFKLWLYGQIDRAARGEGEGEHGETDLLVEPVGGGEWSLKPGWKAGFYVSTLPCAFNALLHRPYTG